MYPVAGASVAVPPWEILEKVGDEDGEPGQNDGKMGMGNSNGKIGKDDGTMARGKDDGNMGMGKVGGKIGTGKDDGKGFHGQS